MVDQLEKVNEETICCSHCGEVLENPEEYNDPDGEAICETCFYDNCFICGNCGDTLPNHLETAINGGQEFVCEDCATRDYYFCEACGEYFTSSEIWYDSNRTICRRCSEDYTICENCDNVIRIEYAFYIGEYAYCCESCSPDDSCEDLIHAYSYRPRPNFLGGESGFYGLELEIDKGDSLRDCAEELLANIPHDVFYLKEDGSLERGLEIVSHPATLEYHLKTFPWERICRIARRNGFLSHDANTCGLHIHASRELLGEGETEQELTIAKIMLLFEKFWESNIVPFSRRNINKLEQWAKKPCADFKPDDGEETVIDKSKKAASGRYHAINLQNEATVEFRIFRGTLRHETILASIQWVDTIIKKAKNTSLSDLWVISWEELVKNDYTELNEYLKLKGGK